MMTELFWELYLVVFCYWQEQREVSSCEPVIHIACCHAILLGSEPIGKLCEQTCTGDTYINVESIAILIFSLGCLYVGRTAEQVISPLRLRSIWQRYHWSDKCCAAQRSIHRTHLPTWLFQHTPAESCEETRVIIYWPLYPTEMSFQINPLIFDWNWPFAKTFRYLCYVRQAMVLSLSVNTSK